MSTDFNKRYAYYALRISGMNAQDAGSVVLTQSEILEEYPDYLIVVHPRVKDATLRVERRDVTEIIVPRAATQSPWTVSTKEGDFPVRGE